MPRKARKEGAARELDARRYRCMTCHYATEEFMELSPLMKYAAYTLFYAAMPFLLALLARDATISFAAQLARPAAAALMKLFASQQLAAAVLRFDFTSA